MQCIMMFNCCPFAFESVDKDFVYQASCHVSAMTMAAVVEADGTTRGTDCRKNKTLVTEADDVVPQGLAIDGEAVHAGAFENQIAGLRTEWHSLECRRTGRQLNTDTKVVVGERSSTEPIC